MDDGEDLELLDFEQDVDLGIIASEAGAAKLMTAVELHQARHATTSCFNGLKEKSAVVQQIQKMWPVSDTSQPRGSLQISKKRKRQGETAPNPFTRTSRTVATASDVDDGGDDDENTTLPIPTVPDVSQEITLAYINSGSTGKCEMCGPCLHGAPCMVRKAVYDWDMQLGAVSKGMVRPILARSKGKQRIYGPYCGRCRFCRPPLKTRRCQIVQCIWANQFPERLQSVLEEARVEEERADAAGPSTSAAVPLANTNTSSGALLDEIQGPVSSDDKDDLIDDDVLFDDGSIATPPPLNGGTPPTEQQQQQTDEYGEDELVSDDEYSRWIPWAAHLGHIPDASDLPASDGNRAASRGSGSAVHNISQHVQQQQVTNVSGKQWTCQSLRRRQRGAGYTACGGINPANAINCTTCAAPKWMGPDGQLQERVVAAVQTGAGKSLSDGEAVHIIAARLAWENGAVPLPDLDNEESRETILEARHQVQQPRQQLQVARGELDPQTLEACKAIKHSLLAKATTKLELACARFVEDQEALMIVQASREQDEDFNLSEPSSPGRSTVVGISRRIRSGAPLSGSTIPKPPTTTTTRTAQYDSQQGPQMSYTSFKEVLLPALTALESQVGEGNVSLSTRDMCALLFALGPGQGWDVDATSELVTVLAEEETLRDLLNLAATKGPQQLASQLVGIVAARRTQARQETEPFILSPRVRSTSLNPEVGAPVLPTQQSQQEAPDAHVEGVPGTSQDEQQQQQQAEAGIAVTIGGAGGLTGIAGLMALNNESPDTDLMDAATDTRSQDERYAALEALTNGTLQLAWDLVDHTLRRASVPVEKQARKNRGKSAKPILEPWEKMRKFPGLPPLPVPLAAAIPDKNHFNQSPADMSIDNDVNSRFAPQQCKQQQTTGTAISGFYHQPVPAIGPLPRTLNRQLHPSHTFTKQSAPVVIDAKSGSAFGAWPETASDGQQQNHQHQEQDLLMGLIQQMKFLPRDVACAFQAGLDAGMRVEAVAAALARFQTLVPGYDGVTPEPETSS